MLLCVVLLCLILVVLRSPAGKLLPLLAVVLVGFCHFSKCVLVHIRIRVEVGAVKRVKALH